MTRSKTRAFHRLNHGNLIRLAGLAALLVVGGCAAFGGNVKGNFACQAPGGICAPTTRIDDQALATMSARAGEPASLQPAGPAARPSAHSPTALKVVLPARRDRFGRWRETSVVYIEPDLTVATTSGDDVTIGGARLSLSELATGAPEMALLQTQRSPATTAEIKEQVDTLLKKAAAMPSATVVPKTSPVAGSVSHQDPAAAVSPTVLSPKFPASSTAGDY